MCSNVCYKTNKQNKTLNTVDHSLCIAALLLIRQVWAGQSLLGQICKHLLYTSIVFIHIYTHVKVTHTSVSTVIKTYVSVSATENLRTGITACSPAGRVSFAGDLLLLNLCPNIDLGENAPSRSDLSPVRHKADAVLSTVFKKESRM